MPLVSAICPDVGELWTTFWQGVASYIPSDTASKFVTEVIVPVGKANGGLRVTVKQGEITTLATLGLANWFTGPIPMTVGALCRAAGFSDPIDLVFGTGPNDADVIVPTLFTAHNQLIQQAVLLNPYVLVGQLVRAFPAVLKNAAALNTKTTFWSGPNDAGSSHLVVRSRNNVPAPSTPLAPAGPTFSRNASPSPIVQVSVSIPQFTDVGLNRNKDIFSAETRTFINPTGGK